ncbi:MAG: hypothetical protein WCJ60_02605 [bacterium]
MSEVKQSMEDLRYVGQAVSKNQNFTEFDVMKDITDVLFEQYKNYLQYDSSLSEFTNDKKRFDQSANEFVKDRSVYSLVGSRLMSGIIWFSYRADQNINNQHDFAIRTCGIGRGLGLSLPFMELSVSDYIRSSSIDVDTINLNVKPANIGAIALYKKFGFKESKNQDDVATVKMDYKPKF